MDLPQTNDVDPATVFAWLHNFRHLRIRFERLATMHEALMKIAACIICRRQLQNSLRWSF
ncbi:hypothetical protein WS83_12455 [Burkholderia sp. MSMB2042]|nr:hypothetical protein WS78_32120 [Burkholderia savannae]KVG49141.1 hypothetical protein WS77_26505 [Burkholderia sp. MSMB0265]KVG85883.1 hypothetical protein WS81_31150 [Burkholderia sp. MSMB2040]KVG92023.1 hypothetical protein WS83_12455 [Burkholderia sp. MSMB2042]KVG97036.1 hypothetical protein WS82_30465 [Burkholderia sp. MSMB2041]KVK91891.1 hypothetical protein WS91_24950 [Burkholderia sp. MSMB1498]